MCLFFSSFLCIMNLYQNTVNRGFIFFLDGELGELGNFKE